MIDVYKLALLSRDKPLRVRASASGFTCGICGVVQEPHAWRVSSSGGQGSGVPRLRKRSWVGGQVSPQGWHPVPPSRGKVTRADPYEIARSHVESPAELRRQRRGEAARRQRKIDGALTCALAVVMIFLACFTVGGMLMVFGYSLFF